MEGKRGGMVCGQLLRENEADKLPYLVSPQIFVE